MNIGSMPSTAAYSTAAETTDASSNSSSSTSTPSVSQDQFLQLLVAQLKNQDPMNPTDSSQFMTELAQFSQLQETIGIHQDMDKLVGALG